MYAKEAVIPTSSEDATGNLDFELIFADIQAEINSGGIQEIATEMLHEVFKLSTDDGEVRTLEQVGIDTLAIWSNPLVQRIDGLAAEIERQHAAFCASHGHKEMALPGLSFIENELSADAHQHEATHDHEQFDDDSDGKKKKNNRQKKIKASGILAIMFGK